MRINRSLTERTPSAVDRQCRGFETACRRRGIRVTPQRLAVYRALASDATHPTAESLYAGLATRMPGLSQGTVYRTLQFLESENLIRRVSGTEAIGRFDANMERHQHLVCRVCGRLVDVSLPEFDAPRLPSVRGFSVEEMDVRLVGRCRDCADPGTAPRPTPDGSGRARRVMKRSNHTKEREDNNG